jgi:hypothetical protein
MWYRISVPSRFAMGDMRSYLMTGFFFIESKTAVRPSTCRENADDEEENVVGVSPYKAIALWDGDGCNGVGRMLSVK